MKKIVIFLMLSMVSVLFAQDNVIYMDVITLKDGSIIKGIIVENKINESIKVEVGLNVFSYKYDEIKNLTKEKSLTTEKTVKQPEESSVYLNQQEIDKRQAESQAKKAPLNFFTTSAGFGFRYFFNDSWQSLGVNKTWYVSWDIAYFKIANALYLGLNGTFTQNRADAETLNGVASSSLRYIPLSLRVKYAFNLDSFYATVGAGISAGHVSYEGTRDDGFNLSVSEWVVGIDLTGSIGWKVLDLFLWEIESGIHLTDKLKEYEDSMSGFFIGSNMGMYF